MVEVEKKEDCISKKKTLMIQARTVSIQILLCCHLSYSFHVPKPKQRHFTHQRNAYTAADGHSIGVNESAATLEETSYSQLFWRMDHILQESRWNHPINTEVDQAHKKDLLWAQRSPLPFEKPLVDACSKMMHRTIEYEPITVEDARANNQDLARIAIRTKASSPILYEYEMQLLKLATEAYWSNQSESSSSRFTYQRRGNSEAHLSDIVTFSREQMGNTGLSELVDDLLLHRIYPWIREAFLSKEKDANLDELGLYVYDSLLIRYNATEANNNNHDNIIGLRKQRVGAGQPLHRDLGYVSVNIMLNDPSEFQGGGTFFEQQLISASIWDETTDLLEYVPDTFSAIKPLGAGHSLAHYSSDRHAGAATFEGVRDILVMFIAAAETANIGSNQPQSAPRWERAARLKTTARPYCQKCFASSDNLVDEWLCRIQHLRLAIDAVPYDGEAWHYLGMTLAEYTNYNNDSLSRTFDVEILDLAIACFEEATKHTPCDARLYNNIGLAWEKKLQSNHVSSQNDKVYMHQKINSAYQKAVAINSICSRLGCDVTSDFERACLNFGLYLSYQDDFHRAVAVLEMIDEFTEGSLDTLEGMSPERQRVIEDARGLLLFCKKHT
jgi:tetratricopeptide (TPR) repeat protein